MTKFGRIAGISVSKSFTSLRAQVHESIVDWTRRMTICVTVAVYACSNDNHYYFEKSPETTESTH